MILSELSFRGYAGNMGETFERMMDDGLNPILAHVDRYETTLIENYFSLGLFGQVNAEAITRRFGRRTLLQWIDEGLILALGSDIHGANDGYAPYTKARAILADRGDRLDAATEDLLSGAKPL